MGKKEAIREAALVEFSIKGYSGASTNEMVKKANVSKGTLFNYYGSKDELYLTLMREAVGKFTIDLGSVTFSSSQISTRFFTLSEKAFDWYAENRDLYHFMITLADATPELQQQYFSGAKGEQGQDLLGMVLEEYKPGDFSAGEMYQVVSWLFNAMKNELTGVITRETALADLKNRYFEKLNILCRFLEKGIRE